MAYDIGPKIGIDGEAEFRQQLNNITQSLKTMDKEMEAATSAFGKNNKSQEALTEQNKILNKQIEAQKKKLEELQKGLKASTEKYGENDIKTQKWKASVHQATADLNRMENQMEENNSALKMFASNSDNAGKKVKHTAQEVDKAKDTIQKFNESAKEVASKTLKTLAASALATATAVVGVVKGTEELRGDLSKLKANAKEAGVGFDTANEALLSFNAISGETDSSIEAISNLLQAGFNDNNLAQAVDALSGAVVKFPDTLKIESLADSLQETIATSAATGQFGELLERLGYNLDDFNEGLKDCTSSTDKQQYALKYLADAGLNRANAEYQQQNETLIENSKQQLKLQENLAEVGGTFAPIVNKAMEKMNQVFADFNESGLPVVRDGLEWMIDNGNVVVSGIGAITAAVIAYKAASVVTEAVSGFKALANAIAVARTAQTALNVAQLASPIGLVTAAITGIVAGVALLAATSSDSKDDVSELGGEIGKLSEKLDTLKADIDETNQSRKETSDSIDSEIGANRQLFDQLNELASVENKSQAEKKRMKNIVDQLNAAMPELNLQYEEEADKLSMTTTEVGKYITAMEQKYRLQAAEKDIANIVNQQYEAQKGLANAQEVYNQALEKAETAQTEMNKAIEEGTNHAPDYAAAVDYANAEVEDAEKVVKEYEKTLDDLDSQYDSTITFIENYTKGNDTASKSIFNLGEVSEDATAAMAESLTELQKKYKETRDSAEDSIDNQLGLFNEISEKCEMTAADMIKSLQKQALATQNWASNLKIAAERGIDQGLLKKLADAGPESAGYLQVIANMTDDQIEEMNRAWRDRYNASQYAAEEMADVQTSIQTSAPAIAETARLAGVLCANAYADGMKSGEPASGVAGAAMAAAAVTAAVNQSGGLTGAGQQGGNNYQAGINSTTGSVGAAAASMAIYAVNEAVNNSGGMYTAGQNAANGYANGIASRVAYVGQAAANMVFAAINAANKAQNSRSPARKFYKPGENAAEGYVIGLENKMDDLRERVTRSIHENIKAADGVVVNGSRLTGSSYARSGLTASDIAKSMQGMAFYANMRELARLKRSL